MNNASVLPSATTQQLLEALAALQARNMEANEALKLERGHAIRAKHAANVRNAAKNVNLQTNSAAPTGVGVPQGLDHRDLNRRPLQNRPTSRTATVLWDAALDLPIAAEAEVQGRWETSLLSDGTHGSVSLSEKKQKTDNAASTALKTPKSYIRKADAMFHPTLEAHRHQDALDLAIVQSEAEADAVDRAELRTIDRDVIKKHLLKGGKLDRRAPVGSLLGGRANNSSGRG
ncbi:hypothetical protein Q7P35_004580 [Cladosporium inversicolor]